MFEVCHSERRGIIAVVAERFYWNSEIVEDCQRNCWPLAMFAADSERKADYWWDYYGI